MNIIYLLFSTFDKNISNREQSKRISPTYFFPDWKMRGKESFAPEGTARDIFLHHSSCMLGML